MNKHKQARRILAWTLSVLMVLGMTPITAIAEETPPAGAGGEIIAFETVTAAVYPDEPAGETQGTVTAFDELPEDIRWQNTVHPHFPATVSGTVAGERTTIPVEWESEENYDEDFPQKGLYVFTAVLAAGYYAEDDAELPRITVYIPADTGGFMVMRMAGEGTEASPLEITTAAQLAEIGELVNAGRLESFLFNDAEAEVSLKLMNDLDLSAYGRYYDNGKGWAPIGDESNPFKGNFDGDNKTITGLYINRPDNDDTGLFGYIKNITAQKLGIVDPDITGRDYVGGVAGTIDGGKLENCYSSAAVAGGKKWIGGVAGTLGSASVIRNCAALNPCIEGASKRGRVLGYHSNESGSMGPISNNYAFSGMNGGGAKTLDGTDGADLTVAQAYSQSFWTSANNWNTGDGTVWSESVWSFANGKLPILKGIPAGVQSGDGGLYLRERNITYAAVSLSQESFAYNGAKQEPSVAAISFNNTALAAGTDYTYQGITSSDDPAAGASAGTNAGIVTLTFTGKGNYTGTKEVRYIIDKVKPAGTPAITAITQAGKTLADAGLTGSFTNPATGAAVPGALSWKLPDTTVIERGRAYEWLFTPEDSRNYDIREGVFTPYPASDGGEGDSDSSGGGGRGSRNTDVKPAAPSAPSTTVSGATATATVTPTVSAEGKAGAVLTPARMSEILGKAQEAAAQSGEKAKIEIRLGDTGKDTGTITGVAVTVPAASVRAMASTEVDSLTLAGGLGSVTLDAAALSTVAAAASGDITITMAKADPAAMPDQVRQEVGERPVYSFSISDGKNTISQFNGAVTVAIPYVPAAGEDPDAIIIYYINDRGGLEIITNGRYDPERGAVVFTTGHFSFYAIGYNKITFQDVAANAWYAKAVTYLSARGITSGTGRGRFSPGASLTRGEFITLLLRAYGITQGIGDGLFAPERHISRQDMAVMLYNALKAVDKLPRDKGAKTLESYTDSDSIAAYAREAMEYMAGAGIISGSEGKLTPNEAATRAQMTRILYDLLSK